MPKSPKRDLTNVVNPFASKPPLWEGPNGEGPNGGVTQGLLGRFLTCRERFRLLTVEGLRSKERFNPRTEYGSMWHIMEESLAESGWAQGEPVEPDHRAGLIAYCQQLSRKYPFDRDVIAHWYTMCATFFPLYAKHWELHPDVVNRQPALQEYAFDVPYVLPSQRTLRLRGKWDSVDLIDGAIWLQENKTKSTINYQSLYYQLNSGFDLQTMLYLVALQGYQKQPKQSHLGNEGFPRSAPIAGVRYNVVRRPAHKTATSALKKFTEDQETNRIGEWFLRFQVKIPQQVIDRFRRETLDPLLEQLYDWWDWVGKLRKEPFDTKGSRGIHFRMPYGVYNPLLEGAATDSDRIVDSGDRTGVERTEVMFPELVEE